MDTPLRYDADIAGMDLFGSIALRASRERIWCALGDPATMLQCIPGCESVERMRDGSLVAIAAIAAGPIDATFRCRLRLFDVEAPTTCTISGEGDAGKAGFATGTAKLGLEETHDGAELSYFAMARMGGMLARLGEHPAAPVLQALGVKFLERLRERIEDEASIDSLAWGAV